MRMMVHNPMSLLASGSLRAASMAAVFGDPVPEVANDRFLSITDGDDSNVGSGTAKSSPPVVKPIEKELPSHAPLTPTQQALLNETHEILRSDIRQTITILAAKYALLYGTVQLHISTESAIIGTMTTLFGLVYFYAFECVGVIFSIVIPLLTKSDNKSDKEIEKALAETEKVQNEMIDETRQHGLTPLEYTASLILLRLKLYLLERNIKLQDGADGQIRAKSRFMILGPLLLLYTFYQYWSDSPKVQPPKRWHEFKSAMATYKALPSAWRVWTGYNLPQSKQHKRISIEATTEPIDEEADTKDTEVTSDNKSNKA